MWRVAHFGLDTSGDVVTKGVLKVVAFVAACKKPPTSNEVEAGDHGQPRDPARAALGLAHTRGWLEYENGPRNSRLWTITDAGRARLMLDGFSPPGSGR